MRVARFSPAIVILVLNMVLVSCVDKNANSSNEQVKGLTQNDADRLNASNQMFASTEKDPPLTAQTYFAAGQLAESQGAYQQALGQYQEALKLQPNYEPALYRTAVVLTQTKQFPQAIAAWQRYISATNGAAIGYNNLAFCYELSGKTSEAEANYKQAIARDPKCVPARNNYGLMLARSGRVDEGLAQMQAVFKPAEAQYNIASALEQMGKKEQAREHYVKALQLDPNFVDAKKRLAEIN